MQTPSAELRKVQTNFEKTRENVQGKIKIEVKLLIFYIGGILQLSLMPYNYGGIAP